MLIPLVCTKCGGKLEVEKSQVFESENAVVVLNDHTFSCPHCGIKYLPGEEIKHFLPQNASISINGDQVGDIVIGHGNVIAHSARVDSAQQDHPVKPQAGTKPPKKWWQFWKM
jgi:predicted RNA-binding Zn-ribbon protein involved in translation (DUF1610 family)